MTSHSPLWPRPCLARLFPVSRNVSIAPKSPAEPSHYQLRGEIQFHASHWWTSTDHVRPWQRRLQIKELDQGGRPMARPGGGGGGSINPVVDRTLFCPSARLVIVSAPCPVSRRWTCLDVHPLHRASSSAESCSVSSCCCCYWWCWWRYRTDVTHREGRGKDKFPLGYFFAVTSLKPRLLPGSHFGVILSILSRPFL